MINKKVYITGFGSFNGVDNNPTEQIIKRLTSSSLSQPSSSPPPSSSLSQPSSPLAPPPSSSSSSSPSLSSSLSSSLCNIDIITEILDVSIEGCQNSNVYKYQKENNNSNDDIIYIHLGVDSSSSCYKLEQYGYNLSHFRCPDNNNNQPKRKPIVNSNLLDESLSTLLPLKFIHNLLLDDGFHVEVSNNPGRFLCNYIYYQSLYQNHSSSSSSSSSSSNSSNVLFIHVPPASVFSIDEQVSFIIRVTQLICHNNSNISKESAAAIAPKYYCPRLLDGRNVVDAIVCGLGGHGSATVARLAKHGASVIGLEQAEKSTHHHGSSHGRSRIIRQAYFEDPRYVSLLKRSFQLWRELQIEYDENTKSNSDQSNEKILNMTGGIMIGKEDSVVVRGTLASCNQWNLPHEVLDSEEIHKRFPAFNVEENEIGIFEDEAGYLVPELAVDAYRELAEKLGAVLKYEEKVIKWYNQKCIIDLGDAQVEDDVVFVETSTGNTYITKKFIITAGPWANDLYGNFLNSKNKLDVERRVLFWFEPTTDVSIFDSIPIYIWDLEDQGNFYGFPFQQGEPGGVKVAMHFVDSNINTICTPETIDRTVSSSEIEAIRNVIHNRMPQLNGKLITTATCMYTTTADGHFLIDFLPNTNNSVIIASPCSGHGFKFCSVVGEILKDMALTNSTAHDISLFKLR